MDDPDPHELDFDLPPESAEYLEACKRRHDAKDGQRGMLEKAGIDNAKHRFSQREFDAGQEWLSKQVDLDLESLIHETPHKSLFPQQSNKRRRKKKTR